MSLSWHDYGIQTALWPRLRAEHGFVPEIWRCLMRALLCSFCGAIFCASLAAGQHGTPIPPGVREADKLPQPADIPPQIKPVQKVADPAQLQRDAQELSTLARNIPSQIDQVVKGGLPKNLGEQLKRIEKLSRQLRKEISR